MVALLSIVIASSWLVFPYFIQGKDLLKGAGAQARMTKGGKVSFYLTRNLVMHPQLDLTATFATSEFFQFVDRASTIGTLRPDRNFIFFVSENIHQGQLSYELPEISLRLGDEEFSPQVSTGPNLAEHHRITVYSIPNTRLDGSKIRLEDYESVRLFVSGKWMDSDKNLTFVGIWDAPYTLPEELKSEIEAERRYREIFDAESADRLLETVADAQKAYDKLAKDLPDTRYGKRATIGAERTLELMKSVLKP